MSARHWTWLLLGLLSCATEGAAYDREAAPAAEIGLAGTLVAVPARESLDDDTHEASAVAADDPASALPGPRRQVIYSASLRIAVVSAADALAAVQRLAEEEGGWVQESEARSITIRVPAARFEPVLARIAALGEVIERSIRSSDVTEQVFDLELRLDNLRRARERLLEHLAKSERVEDTLKIEAELTRVTGEIELLEGKLRFLQSQIAMSTIRVSFDADRQQASSEIDLLGVPFEWVGRLGDGLVAGAVEARPRKPGIFASGPSFEPPPEFIRYYSDKSLVEALSADGVRIKVQKHDNYDGGALEFWRVLARRSLVAGRALVVTSEERLDEERVLIRGSREVAGRAFGYAVVLVRKPKTVFTFETWGPLEAFDARAKALLASARTLNR